MKNQYITTAVRTWHIKDRTYCLIENAGNGEQYIVKVVPDDLTNYDSYWFEDGHGGWETESGAAWSILNSLDDGS